MRPSVQPERPPGAGSPDLPGADVFLLLPRCPELHVAALATELEDAVAFAAAGTPEPVADLSRDVHAAEGRP